MIKSHPFHDQVCCYTCTRSKKEGLTHNLVGPKNRLLKGDVLAFLDNPDSLLSSFTSITHAYYSTDVSVSFDEGSMGLRVADVVDRVTTAALECVPQGGPFLNTSQILKGLIQCTVHSSKPVTTKDEMERIDLCVTRGSKYGLSPSRLIDNVQGLSGRKLSRKLSSSQQEQNATNQRSKYFTLLDYTQVSPLTEIEEPYLKPLESGILIVRSIDGGSDSKGEKVERDVLDVLLTGSSQNTKIEASSLTAPVQAKSTDLLDILSTTPVQSPKTLRLELITDGKRVTGQSAIKFLKVWKDLSESRDKWRGLL